MRVCSMSLPSKKNLRIGHKRIDRTRLDEILYHPGTPAGVGEMILKTIIPFMSSVEYFTKM